MSESASESWRFSEQSVSARPEALPPWRHFGFSTYGTWIRGDERGFRDHDGRIYSSGNYKCPPPREEHAPLRRWVLKHMHKPPVILAPALKIKCGQVLANKLRSQGVELLILAVLHDHVHGLGRFPGDEVDQLMGNAKRASSHAVREEIPGVVWAKKGWSFPVATREK